MMILIMIVILIMIIMLVIVLAIVIVTAIVTVIAIVIVIVRASCAHFERPLTSEGLRCAAKNTRLLVSRRLLPTWLPCFRFVAEPK